MANYSHIKSKVAHQTWSNADHKPGGGDVEITDEKLNWNAVAKVWQKWMMMAKITPKPKVRLGKK